MGMSPLDANQVIRSQAITLADGSLAQSVIPVGGSLVPEQHDEIEITYIGAGPGTGEIGTVVYKFETVTVATLTLTYDGSNRLTGVVRS